MNSTQIATPTAGAAVAGATIANHIGGRAVTTLTHSASGNLTTGVYHAFEHVLRIRTNGNATIVLRALTASGSLTPQIGSFLTCRRISTTVGNFV
jgi:hypothetical protein